MSQMGGHHSQFKRRLFVAHIFIALSENCPWRWSPWLDANNLAHNANRVWDIVVDIGLVSFTNQGFDLLRENRAYCATFLRR